MKTKLIFVFLFLALIVSGECVIAYLLANNSTSAKAPVEEANTEAQIAPETVSTPLVEIKWDEKFNLVLPRSNGIRNVEFHLAGTVKQKEEEDAKRLLVKCDARIKDAVVVTLRELNEQNPDALPEELDIAESRLKMAINTRLQKLLFQEIMLNGLSIYDDKAFSDGGDNDSKIYVQVPWAEEFRRKCPDPNDSTKTRVVIFKLAFAVRPADNMVAAERLAARRDTIYDAVTNVVDRIANENPTAIPNDLLSVRKKIAQEVNREMKANRKGELEVTRSLVREVLFSSFRIEEATTSDSTE